MSSDMLFDGLCIHCDEEHYASSEVYGRGNIREPDHE
jgi:hypothetical protein